MCRECSGYHVELMQSTAPLIYPSLLAQHSLDSLLHPPAAFISAPPSSIPSPSSWMQKQLPCDIFLLNLRSVFQSSSESALILHRRGFDCGFDMNPLTCELTNGTVSNFAGNNYLATLGMRQCPGVQRQFILAIYDV